MPRKLTIPEQPLTPHTIVGDAGDHYECDTPAAVKRHITALTEKIRDTDTRFVRLRDLYMRDRDTLIELYGSMCDA